jgi:hypothetical protein
VERGHQVIAGDSRGRKSVKIIFNANITHLLDVWPTYACYSFANAPLWGARKGASRDVFVA